jgi:hypothetical protein
MCSPLRRPLPRAGQHLLGHIHADDARRCRITAERQAGAHTDLQDRRWRECADLLAHPLAPRLQHAAEHEVVHRRHAAIGAHHAAGAAGAGTGMEMGVAMAVAGQRLGGIAHIGGRIGGAGGGVWN